jgi:hypothetical protein
MASKFTKPTAKATEDDTFSQLKRHYQLATQETDKRRTGVGRVGAISFDESDELFRSWLNEKKWPYDALLFDPRVFTFILEKNARLFSNKIQGRLIPREGGDVLSAQVNSELLDFQWDQASHDSTMLEKWSLMDLNTRKYGSSFALCKWRYEVDSKKKVVFDGPEMKVLNNRDCLPDPTATSIESCNWFQVREYVTLQDLEQVNDQSRDKPVYKNLDQLRDSVGGDSTHGGDTRDTNWISRNRTISGLTSDPYGQDDVFKTVELVTEYRKDKWYTFSPKHGVILREIDNPYGNYEIPIVMLRYFVIDDDLYGLSEIEPVKSLQKAINALVSQYVDEINQKLYSPIAIGPGVRQHTLEWGKGARWQMNNPMTDYRLVESQSNAAQYFNNTYSMLVSAFMNAIGETSLGVSNIGAFQKDKTATEVKQLVQQRNARDAKNQNSLSESIKRQMMLWHQMNQKMLFTDPEQRSYIIRIVGKDAIEYFQQQGLDKYGLTSEAATLAQQNPDMNPQSLETPLYPVNTGSEKEPKVVPKFSYNRVGRVGSLVVEPEDLKGSFDFIADVQSMQLGAGDDERSGRDMAMKTILQSPVTVQLLQQDKVKPKFRELLVAWLDDNGFKDAEKYFEAIPQDDSVSMQSELMKKMGAPSQQKPPSTAINYKDLPPEGQSQLAQQAGLNIGGNTQQPPPNIPMQPPLTPPAGSTDLPPGGAYGQ